MATAAGGTHPTGMHFYRPKRSFGQGNIFTPVCHSVHGGVPGQAPPPGRQAPLQADTPPPGRHPPSRQAPPLQAGTPPSRQAHPPPGRHPPSRQAPPFQADTPLSLQADTPPLQADTPPRDTVNARPVRILLECILVLCVECSFMCFLGGLSLNLKHLIGNDWPFGTRRTLRHILGPILVIFEIYHFLMIPGLFEYFSENV